MIELMIVIILLALIFDFGNGMNDAANAIASVIATRVLSVRKALLLAACGDFLGPFIAGVAVATTMGTGIIDPNIINSFVIISALIGAVFWTYLLTFKGFPISVTHALIGGLVGAGIMKAGIGAVFGGKLLLVILFIAMAPIFGFIGGLVFSISVLWIFRKSKPFKVNSYFKKLQLGSSFLYSLSHGANNAQNSMGIISISLFTAGYLGTNFFVPLWVIIICASAMALGTFTGGLKVIRTMGTRLTKLRPIDGFNAESSGSVTIFLCTALGIPVSTTHVICGSIIGTGATKRLSAVKWGLARNIVYAWILTIPVSALVGAGIYLIISLF